jgi:hypothetical protein
VLIGGFADETISSRLGRRIKRLRGKDPVSNTACAVLDALQHEHCGMSIEETATGETDSHHSGRVIHELPREQPKGVVAMAEQRLIVGGRAHMGMPREKGPQGKEVGGARKREIEKGDNGPSDGWYPFDCTPKDQNGVDFGPMPNSEYQAHPNDQYDRQTNPEVEGVPSWDGKTTSGTSGDHQVVRLTWDEELTSGSAELVHEGANHGCTPRIKTRDARGKLVNLRFVAANGVVIPVSPSTLHIGRQE